MRIPGLKTTRQLVRQFRSRILGGGIVLGYHRIANEADDPFAMSVSPGNFAEQMAVIWDLAEPVPLQTLVQQVRDEKPLRRSLALTMDDGYSDNLYEALPVLDNYQIPATIFVVSGFLGQAFWWDELARLVFTKEAFAAGLSLTIAGRPFEWQMQAAEPAQAQREALYQTLYFALRPLQAAERQRVLQELVSLVGDVPLEGARHKVLTTAELSTLADSRLIEIGSHTHSHAELDRLDPNHQLDEIKQSHNELSEIIGRVVSGFSFPFGSYTSQSQEILRRMGYSYACSSNPDTVRSASQCYQLPRLWVPNVDGEQFGRWISRWLGTA